MNAQRLSRPALLALLALLAVLGACGMLPPAAPPSGPAPAPAPGARPVPSRPAPIADRPINLDGYCNETEDE